MSAAVALGSLPSATWVDETLLSETDRAIVIRCGTFVYISTPTFVYISAHGLNDDGTVCLREWCLVHPRWLPAQT